MKTQFKLSTGRIAALDTHDPVTLPKRDAPGAALLFVPGYTGSKEDFLPLLRPLAALGFRAVAIDQRGQYESEWADGPNGYRMSALAADVCEVADVVLQRSTEVHLVGHSFGGLVSRAAVLADGDRFSSLTLMSSGPGAIDGPRRAVIDGAEAVLSEQGQVALWEHLQAQSQADPSWVQVSPAVQRFLRNRFLANDPIGLQVMGSELRREADLTEQLANSGLPKLVLYGASDDAWAPAVQADMARRLSARHAVIADAAHSPAIENPTATLEELAAFVSHRG